MESFSSLVESLILIIIGIAKPLIVSLSLNLLLDTIYLHLFFVILLALISALIFNKLILESIRKSIARVNHDIGKYLLQYKVFKPIGWVFPIFIFDAGLGNFSPDGGVINRITEFLIIIVLVISFTRFLSVLSETWKNHPVFSGTPIKSYVQLLKLIIYLFGLVIAFCVISDTSPWTILSGLGALTAIIILVFRDTILGLVASIQIFGSDTIREGDWVTIPSLDIDGDCIEVSLHTVTVRSFDQALITFPTSKLLEHPFKNWRGIEKAGGRRIKRSLLLDQDSVDFLTPEIRERLQKIKLLANHFKEKDSEIFKANSKLADSINHRRLTNIGVFRAYILSYLKSDNNINQELTMMVRQLKPGTNGLPLEIYAFTKSTDWVKYETIQSDIFDHLLAVMHLFNLRLIQYPSGHDIRNIGKNLKK